jgi:hypothetical protein
LEAFDELFTEEEQQPNSSQAFIVRVWSESSGESGDQTGWRGSIQTVGSDSRLYFHDLGAIRRFIEESLQLTRRPRTWWQALLHKLGLYD